MKKIIFIDDIAAVLEVQQAEMIAILEKDGNTDVEIENIQCDMTKVADCLDDAGKKQHEGEDRYAAIHQILDSILEKVNTATAMIHGADDKVEAVIDLFLDDLDGGLGLKLAKFILEHMENRECFEDQSFMLTITSSYISADFSALLAKHLAEDERQYVVECYRPFLELPDNKYKIDKSSTAFPEFYHQYHCEGEGIPSMINKLLLDTESVSDNTGTYYGNYFGLIYARLYKDEGN